VAPVPAEHFLAHLLWISSAVSHELDDELGDHPHNRVITLDQLKVVQQPVERRRHDGDLLNVRCST
jgi:hypothetical protein